MGLISGGDAAERTPGVMDTYPTTSGAALATIAVVVILLIVWAAGYLHFGEGMTASPTGLSTGTSNHKSAGNNPLWAHGSHAAGGLISVGDAPEQTPGVNATLLSHWATEDQKADAAAQRRADAADAAAPAFWSGVQKAGAASRPYHAERVMHLGSTCDPGGRPRPSAAAQQDLAMARAAGSVNF